MKLHWKKKNTFIILGIAVLALLAFLLVRNWMGYDDAETELRYSPTEDEFHGLLDGNPRYSLLLRGGYMAGSSIPRFQHLRKKSIYAFSEGSVFFTTKELTGKIADLRPDWDDPKMHPVYRSGLAFSIKIKDTRK